MRILFVVLVALLLLLNAQLWLSEDRGLPHVKQLQAEVAQQQEENARLAERNDSLKAEVKSLRDGLEAIEERARVELGMIRKGETFFRILASSPPADNDPDGTEQPVARR